MRALLLFGDTIRSPALRHEIPLSIIDPLLFAEVEGRQIVLTSMLERDRIAAALPDAEVLDYVAHGFREQLERGLSFSEAGWETAARVVGELGIDEALVPGDLPLALGDRLRAGGVTLVVDDAAVELRRRAKSAAELDGIRIAQRAAEAGMAAASDVLARAVPGAGGRLELEGRPLLAEDVRAALRAACSRAGAPCPPDVIVASVWQGTGHEPGSGPLPAGLPIGVDLWPQHEETGCWADMARTFVVGTPAPDVAAALAEQERHTRAVLDAALASIRPGVTGRALHDAACARFEAAGYATQRTSPRGDEDEGFQWSLGHGVGLDPHEAPSVGLAGHDELLAGDVLAIEPGVWDARIGGITLEDLVLVTEDGCERLTRFPYDLRPRAA